MSSKVILAYCTFPSENVAREICRQLVIEGTIACANLLPAMQSVYQWQGRLIEETECAAVLKLAVLKQGRLRERIRDMHPYSVPALVFLPVDGGNAEFLNWIYAQTL
ncbi:MAG TPA: divalent-cation tolerance protein CutA [Bdellovibrionales bacterium]|nr:divalent-cation tolerance protein CutA [Bdellovibrionales bacterium]